MNYILILEVQQVKKFETETGGVSVIDSDTHVHIKMVTSQGDAGYVYGSNNTDIGLLDGNGAWHVKGIKDGAVELFHGMGSSTAAAKKFETTSAGATVSGSLGIGNTSPIGTLEDMMEHLSYQNQAVIHHPEIGDS